MADEVIVGPSAQLDRRLEELEANRICPICRTSRWWIIDTEEGLTSIPVSGGRRLPTYTLGCICCGYVQQFIREVVEGNLPPATNEPGNV